MLRYLCETVLLLNTIRLVLLKVNCFKLLDVERIKNFVRGSFETSNSQPMTFLLFNKLINFPAK